MRLGLRLFLLILCALPALSVHGQTGPAGTVPGEVRALLSARHKTTLASQVAGQLTDVTVRFGERFQAGDVLFRLDCRMYEEQARRAEIDLKGARQMLAFQRKLERLGSGNERDRVEAELERDRAASELDRNRLMVTYCTAAAPFPGRVVERKAQPFQQVGVGQPVLEILDDGSFDVNMIVPSFWLSWLERGTPFHLRIDETGQVYAGTVTAIGAQIDAASQSLKITGALTGTPDGLVAGMSGTARFALPAAFAQGVPAPRRASSVAGGSDRAEGGDDVARPAWVIRDGVARPVRQVD